MGMPFLFIKSWFVFYQVLMSFGLDGAFLRVNLKKQRKGKNNDASVEPYSGAG
ncbi:hypothetical protein PFWH6_5447 [Pseudomonas fluorescens WH6]|nr:hypothetical protein PFWH6_5447 [Pseudomonas fluorescens WH6]